MTHQRQELQQRIERLFTRHRDRLDRLSPAELRAAARQFDSGGGGGTVVIKQVCVWTSRVALCLLAAAVAANTLKGELVAGGYATQSTEWLAAFDLAGQKLFRRVAHAFRLYEAEPVRGMGECLLANPFGRTAPVCCGCRPVRVAKVRVAHGNLTKVAEFIDSLYSRAVSPFLLTGPPAELRVEFARLAGFVAEHRPEFERGANTVQGVASGRDSAATVRRFDDLFPDGGSPPVTEPPADQLLMWSFSHLSAVRALRRLVPRPAYFGQRTERMLSTTLLIAGPRWLSRESGGFDSVGDFPGRRALAYAVPLSGRLTARLGAKAACCGGTEAESAAAAATASEVTLEPGRVLFFPTDCHELLVGGGDGPALVYVGFVYNGAHQARRKKDAGLS